MPLLNAAAMTNQFKSVFAHNGYPETVVIDDSPPLPSAEYSAWLFCLAILPVYSAWLFCLAILPGYSAWLFCLAILPGYSAPVCNISPASPLYPGNGLAERTAKAADPYDALPQLLCSSS